MGTKKLWAADGLVDSLADGLAGRLARWTSELTMAAVPVDVERAALRSVLDTVGISLAGESDFTLQMAEHARANYSGGVASVMTAPPQPRALSAVGAALVNGARAHVLDYDDTHYAGVMHGSAVLFPASLAVAEQVGATGEAFLEAFVAGSEVAYGLADVCTTHHYHLGWWSTATLGVVGGAAASAKLLGADAAQIGHAIALAASQAFGARAVLGTHAKPYLAGRAATLAVEAGQLSVRGICGPRDAFEHPFGFLKLLNHGVSEPHALDDLGQRWRLTDPGVLIKRFPICSANLAAVEAAEVLARGTGFAPSAIELIECEVSELAASSLRYEDPTNEREAQFCLPFAVACMLLEGDIQPGHLGPDYLASPDLRALMGRVKTGISKILTADRDAPEGAWVRIRLSDGSAVEHCVRQARGMPSLPLTDEALGEKFLRCARHGGMDPPAAHELAQRLARIRELENVGELWSR